MHTPSAPAAICLSTDRLSAGMLGAYGNSWVGTPCFDRLAFSALLADQMFLTRPTLDAFYSAVWHADTEPASAKSIAHVYASHGADSLLVTDEKEVASIEGGFTQVSVVGNDEAAAKTEPQKTETENFFSAATEHLMALEQPAFVWLHTRCLADHWDAPYEMREWYAAEDDPPPPTSQQAPHFYGAESIDPDELLGWAQAYAAQVSLWDQCLGELIAVIDQHPIFKDSLLLIVGCRGFPLGEHRCVGKGAEGSADGDLYSELLQLPLLARFPGGQKATRLNRLLQPHDLFTALHDWCIRWPAAENQEPDFFASSRERPAVLSEHANGNWSVRTPAWFLRAEAGEKMVRELYFKPDDRWEVNNLAERCSEVVSAIEAIHQQVICGKPIGPLDDILTSGLYE